MQTSVPESLSARLEQLTALDPLSERLQSVADRIIPEGSRTKDVLSGTWLGHPLHPALTDVVVGAWTSAFLLDVLGGKRSGKAADRLIGIGIISALPTAASGLSDWADTSGSTRRLGSIHAAGNTAALLLHALSWRSRRRGRRGRGKLLSMTGFAIANFSAYVGGHLSYAKGVGVNQTAFERVPAGWTAVLDEAQLLEDTLVGGHAEGVDVLLVRRGGSVRALADRCSHRGCLLHEGELDGDTVVCRCHGSTFLLEDGSIVTGPATSPQPVYDARLRDGRVEVRARPA
jgi:nitrite reductase/ring-hydroxylating ferredoxin subunit/uncharacterized membrane protein